MVGRESTMVEARNQEFRKVGMGFVWVYGALLAHGDVWSDRMSFPGSLTWDTLNLEE